MSAELKTELVRSDNSTRRRVSKETPSLAAVAFSSMVEEVTVASGSPAADCGEDDAGVSVGGVETSREKRKSGCRWSKRSKTTVKRVLDRAEGSPSSFDARRFLRASSDVDGMAACRSSGG